MRLVSIDGVSLWLRSLALVGLSLGIPLLVLPQRTQDFLTGMQQAVGPTFLALLLFTCLTLGCMVRALAHHGEPGRALRLSRHAVTAASLALWCGVIGTYWALQKSMVAGVVTEQFVGEAMLSTLFGALAVVLAGSFGWAIDILADGGADEDQPADLAG